jgi:hypothetical protein
MLLNDVTCRVIRRFCRVVSHSVVLRSRNQLFFTVKQSPCLDYNSNSAHTENLILVVVQFVELLGNSFLGEKFYES